ncbi:hypothetical protein KSF_003570 [Reticulibacter mediterranei]|uniref:Activator of Hsp90 ATPase homologue 1/2-like C-terminal domain-containing protein n=1 Tax=Reticulibacter mediterranei TaxID=2778369 RepID=A0A8J3MWX0_9CHLR|nr:SRPBCC domain-containing protein [Reticulibacter mediterranei]GHO90309.1 hypothetical protein KSF_003570 [Reticulibacter mediterranei]
MTNQNETKIHAQPGHQEILITREFDAPRELVFKVITDPKLLPQWWGPRYLSTEVDKIDMRSGGQWRFIQRDTEGREYAFSGVYHEVLAPERIINTFEFEGLWEQVIKWCVEEGHQIYRLRRGATFRFYVLPASCSLQP